MAKYEILDDAPPAQAATAGYEILPDAPAAPMSRFEKYKQGVRDPIDGGAQLLTHMLPTGVVEAGNKFNNWLADKTGLVGRIEEGGIDKQIADREQQYQAQRAAAGETGIDGYRMAGNVLNPVNIGIGGSAGLAARAITKAPLLARAALGAGVGAASSSITPVTSGNFSDEKANQMQIGGMLGGALPIVGAGLGRVISPEVRQGVKTLLAEKVTPTMGQILGGAANTLEDKLTSLPLVGDAIRSARGKSLDEFNRAAMARALKPIEGAVPAETGRDAIAAVRGQLGDKYNSLLPRLQFKADPQFSADIARIQSMSQNLAPQEAAKYVALMKQHFSKLSPNGTMTGETFKTVESALGQDAKQFLGSGDPYQRELGGALKETLESFRTALARSTTNPADAASLKAINTGYANYARLRQAAGGIGAVDGKFTPAQLASAVRAMDQTTGKRAYSEGTALMQDLTDAGKSVLSQKYPDSGTAGRLTMNMIAGGGAAGAAAINPAAVAGAALGVTPYLPGGRQAMAALLARRPDLAKPIAEAVRTGSTIAIPGLTPAMIQNQGNQ